MSQCQNEFQKMHKKKSMLCAAGWVARTLKARLVKSVLTHLTIMYSFVYVIYLTMGTRDLVNARNWVEQSDHGGLTRVNDITFELFTAMEKNMRKIVRVDQAPSLMIMMCSIS